MSVAATCLTAAKPVELYEFKIGNQMPQVQVVVMDKAAPTLVSLSDLLKKDKVVLISSTGAFTQDLSDFIPQQKWMQRLGLKVYFIASDTIYSLEAWKAKYSVDGIKMISDCQHQYAEMTHLAKNILTSGYVLQRFGAILDNGKIIQIKIPSSTDDDRAFAASILMGVVDIWGNKADEQKKSICHIDMGSDVVVKRAATSTQDNGASTMDLSADIGEHGAAATQNNNSAPRDFRGPTTPDDGVYE